MNHSVYYSNKDSDDIASETWPDLLLAMGDYPYPSVPQSTHPYQVVGPGYPNVGSYVPDFNAADPYRSVPQSTHPGQVYAPGYPNFSAVDTYQSVPQSTHPGQVSAPGYPNFSTVDPYQSVPQSTHPGQVFAPGYPTVGSNVPDFNAADHAALSLPAATEIGAFANLQPSADFTNQDFIDLWSMPALSPLNVNSAVSQPRLVGYPNWTSVAPLAAYSAATTPASGVSPTSTTPTSHDELAWLSEILETPPTTPASSPGDGGKAGRVAPECGANLSEARTSPAGWDASGFSWPIPVAPGNVTSNVTTIFPPTVTLGKRHREAEQPRCVGGPVGTHAHETQPPKRARGSEKAKGFLKATRSVIRTRDKPAARIPKPRKNGKPKKAGRGAERLATPSSQGIYHQSLPGPSFQQDWAVDATNGKPTWVEGSVVEEAVHHIDSTVQQEQQQATECFKIPRKFEPWYRLFLQTSKADIARGAVQAIKCRVCPDANLRNFEEFKRHCKTSEAHPQELHFCDRCGDYFARSDALNRHRKSPPPECKLPEDKVALEKAVEKAMEKRRETEEAHTVFIRHLNNCLAAGAPIGRTFSQIIKDMYPGSSKKRTGGSK